MLKRIFIILALCTFGSAAPAQFPPIGIRYSVFHDSLLRLCPQSVVHMANEHEILDVPYEIWFDSVILERFCGGSLAVRFDSDSIVRSLFWNSDLGDPPFLFGHFHSRLVARYGPPVLTSVRSNVGSDSEEYFVSPLETAELSGDGTISLSIQPIDYPVPTTQEQTIRFVDPCRHKLSVLLPSSWVQQPCDAETVTDTTTLVDVVWYKDGVWVRYDTTPHPFYHPPVEWLSGVDTLSPELDRLPIDSAPKARINQIITRPMRRHDSTVFFDVVVDSAYDFPPPTPVFEPFSFDGWKGYFIVRQYEHQSPSLIAAFVRGKQELEVLMRVPMEMLLLYKPFFLRTIKTIRVEE
jgi:hypothetical protein